MNHPSQSTRPTNQTDDLLRVLGTRYPIIQAGMIWCSGWELASAVSMAGGLGTLGAGSMRPAELKQHLERMTEHCDQPFAVNLPLLYPQIQEHLGLLAEFKVPIIITSAGSPGKWTSYLHDQGAKVLHVVSSTRFAVKAQEAGVDAVIAEGFEAGGHNGREETTTLCLIPAVRKAIDVPLVAAGGIGSGEAIAAALVLGADGVQIGSRYVATPESSAHPMFKEKILQAAEGDTHLALKGLTPVRLLDNPFAQQVREAEKRGDSLDELQALLGRGRAKKGMAEGDMSEGELEIGQVSAQLDELTPAGDLTVRLWEDAQKRLQLFGAWASLR
ncbi:MAG: NAD(P)H-dependent flavin oxidoreductase [Bacteroidota bacterium]